MAEKPYRTSKERRQINLSYGLERRRSVIDRRTCPKCKGDLRASKRKVATGTVTILACVRCGWKESSEQVDSKVLMAKLTWAMQLEKKAGALMAALPRELVDSLELKPGDELVLEPLTLPVGSLEMQWRLTLRKKS